MDKKAGWMYLACGLIVGACAVVFAMGFALAREAILFEERIAPYAAAVYGYGIGAALPPLAAVGMLGMVVREIGRGRAFSRENAGWMLGIARMAAVECAYIVAGLVGWGCAGLMHPGIVIAAAALVMFGAAIGILAWALSVLIRRADALQQENDLTI